ncbi:MAG: DUF1858 domain-containing protein [Candidatus Aminicenantes bacterium]|nr:DUF1858 domain-containing protein [Candidatus Aminicenantes bacterium]
MADPISLTTPIEEIVLHFPEAVGFLSRHGVRCIRCGEPLWCTLGELLEEDKIENPQKLVEKLNDFITSGNK